MDEPFRLMNGDTINVFYIRHTAELNNGGSALVFLKNSKGDHRQTPPWVPGVKYKPLKGALYGSAIK